MLKVRVFMWHDLSNKLQQEWTEYCDYLTWNNLRLPAMKLREFLSPVAKNLNSMKHFVNLPGYYNKGFTLPAWFACSLHQIYQELQVSRAPCPLVRDDIVFRTLTSIWPYKQLFSASFRRLFIQTCNIWWMQMALNPPSPCLDLKCFSQEESAAVAHKWKVCMELVLHSLQKLRHYWPFITLAYR